MPTTIVDRGLIDQLNAYPMIVTGQIVVDTAAPARRPSTHRPTARPISRSARLPAYITPAASDFRARVPTPPALGPPLPRRCDRPHRVSGRCGSGGS